MTIRERILPPGWYPTSPGDCEAEIKDFLSGFEPPSGEFIGAVAPHAGWAFSGRAAAKVFYTLSKGPGVDRIVLYAGHLSGSSPAIVYADQGWETPMGTHPLDYETALELSEKGSVKIAGRDFMDNTAEVQLPFLAYFFPDVPTLAVHSPSSHEAIELGRTITQHYASKNLSAIYIGSADLTHYGPNYGFTPKGTGPQALKWVKEENDRRLVENALDMNATELINDAAPTKNTCSAGPIASVIASCKERDVSKGHLVEYYTSYDISPGDSFVGYAAIVY